jgi:ABC-type transport system involved in multi-copper enzyme maturation permease subunit
MLWYKAWRESRARFVLSGLAIAAISAGLAFFYNDAARSITDGTLTYPEYIWRIAYKGYLRELFVMLSLLLGVGGLLRERDHCSAGFTLSLPVTRGQLLAWKAAAGIVEIVALSFLPAVLVPLCSGFAGTPYPWAQALKFGLLWVVGGTFVFMIGFLASTVLGGEYSAPVAALLGLLLYSGVAEAPLGRWLPNVHDFMNGTGMPYFRSTDFVLLGPLPWTKMAVILLMALGLFAASRRIILRRDF